MKNIHLIPTEKPSRLYILNSIKKLYYTNYNLNQIKFTVNQNIYITSDEEIKEGDWCIDEKENIVKADKDFIFNCSHEFNEFWKKIILTTDQDLIKDGVQSIDDEFLEWFVKNPSCESIEVEKVSVMNDRFKLGYKIIIPKEEPKQETLEEAKYRVYKDYWNENHNQEIKSNFLTAFKLGAKWQQEQDKNKYSEEEVNEIIAEAWNSCEDNEGETFTEVRKRIIEQFKKK